MIYLYDGTFDGFLSVVFECYEKKSTPELIAPVQNFQSHLLAQPIHINTDEAKSQRVWNGLQKKITVHLNQLPYLAFLSRQTNIEMHLLRFIQLVFSSPSPIENNFSDVDVLEVRKAAKLVTREAMRMLQFVRFQKTLDDIYFSAISPAFDVLPLTTKHFTERFSDQNWVLYDLKRDYGFFYNQKKIEQITLKDKQFNENNGFVSNDILYEDEVHYQTLWKNYCKNITIRERLNHKVHKQHMPKRYWKFLIEKRF